MAKITLQNGKQISFPDGLQPDQVKKIITAASGDQSQTDAIRHPLDTSGLTPDSPAVPWYTPATSFFPNAYRAGAQLVSGGVNQASHLFDTVDTPLGKMPLGMMGPAVHDLKSIFSAGKSVVENPQATLDAVTQSASDNFGTPTRAWNTVATHPFDALMMAAPGLGMVGKGAELANMTKTANALSKASEFTNPINLVGKPIYNYGPSLAKTVAPPVYAYFEPKNMANSIFDNAITKSGQTKDALVNSIKSAIAEGQPQFTNADALGQRGQELLASVARSPNDMQQTIAETLANRQAGQSSRVGNFVKTGLDAHGTAQKMASGLTKLRNGVADSLYTAARSDGGPVDLTGAINKIDEIVGPTTKYDVGISPDSTEGALLALRNQLASGTAKNGITSRSDFNRILSMKGDLKDTIDSLYASGKSKRASALDKVYTQLDAALADSSKSYRAANDTFAQMSRPIDAVESGQQAARGSVRAADNITAYQSMAKDPVSQMAYKSGYADPLLGKIEASAQGANTARPLLADKYQQEFGAFSKNPAKLNRQLTRENTMHATAQRALSGSKTDMNLINEAGMSSVSPTDLFHAATHGIGGLVNLGMKTGTNFLTGRNSAVRSLLAKQLLGNTLPAAKLAKLPFNDKEWIKALIAGRSASASTATPPR